MSSGASPRRMRCTRKPSCAPASAVARQWLDCTAAASDEGVAALLPRRRGDEFELAHLVAAEGEAGEVVPLHPQAVPAAVAVTEAREQLQGCGGLRQRDARWVVHLSAIYTDFRVPLGSTALM